MFKVNEVCNNPVKNSNDFCARTAVLETSHGHVQTPTFMPVATKAYVKTVTPEDLISIGTDVIIANSFLLYLRPGLEIINKSGGIHKFMNWPKSIFTDSGGFQMIRPDFHAMVDQQGITFQSPFDGTKHLITPEKCIQIQLDLKVDVAMVLDHCPEYGGKDELIKIATENTTTWAKRSIEELNRLKEQKDDISTQLFGIVQGGLNKKLRQWSAKSITELDFDGFGIGGLSIGEPKKSMYEVLNHQLPMLPNEKPRYLMGVGSPEDLLESIGLGVDIFDSVFPTRNARHGTIHTSNGNININRASYSNQFSLIDEDCGCSTCTAGFTRAYLNHLLKNYSILGMRLATIHNLFFIQKLIKTTRARIKDGTFFEFKNEFLEKFQNNSTKSN